MIPTQGNGVDAVNFRSLKESESVDISRSRPAPVERTGDVTERQEDKVDPFGDFNSGILLPEVKGLIKVTLHYDGDDYHSDEQLVRDHRNALAEA